MLSMHVCLIREFLKVSDSEESHIFMKGKTIGKLHHGHSKSLSTIFNSLTKHHM